MCLYSAETEEGVCVTNIPMPIAIMKMTPILEDLTDLCYTLIAIKIYETLNRLKLDSCVGLLNNKNMVGIAMSKNFTLTNTNTEKNNEPTDMDGLIKFILAIMLASMPFLFEQQMSFGILSVYLLIATLVLRIKFRTLLLSAASYCIIVLMPYLFGFLMNSLLYSFTNNELFTYNQGTYEIVLRLFRLFIIWYVSILYFHTTPIKTIIGLVDKLFFPLKLIGVPVKDYLKVVMCIFLELKGMGTEIKKNFVDSARSTIGGKNENFKMKMKGVSQIIVSLLVNSFEKLDKIQSFVEKVSPEDLYHYKFNVSKRDVVAVMSFILLTWVLLLVERGY